MAKSSICNGKSNLIKLLKSPWRISKSIIKNLKYKIKLKKSLKKSIKNSIWKELITNNKIQYNPILYKY